MKGRMQCQDLSILNMYAGVLNQEQTVTAQAKMSYGPLALAE